MDRLFKKRRGGEGIVKQVVIIGAGPAGLTAACELAKKQSEEYHITILEECAQPGGISRTVSVGGNRMDLGGHRFFSKDERVMSWWKNLFPVQGELSYDDKFLGRCGELNPGGPDPEQEDLVFLKRNRVSRIYYQTHFFDYPVTMNWSTVRNLGIGRTLRAGFSYLRAMIWKRPERSLEDFYVNRFGKELYETFFEDYTTKLWGRHPREISPDWGAQRVKGLSIRAVIKDMLQKLFHVKNRHTETSLIESFYYPKYGPGQLWQEAANQFEARGGEILYGCQVKQIHQKNGAVDQVVYERDGISYELEADAVFSSMPVKDLVAGMNEVPAEMRRIASGLPYRDFVTVGIQVDRLLLKNRTDIPTLGNIVPDCWIYVQDRGVKLGRIQIFNNWSPYMVEYPEQKVWIGLEYFCHENDAMWNMSEQEWVELGRSELIRIGVLDPATEVEKSHCEKVKKAYPAYFDTYSEMKTLEHWLMGIGGLYCIGRNGQHRYNNMDHSMLTAMEAVSVFCGEKSDQNAIWNVNTEQEYHEEKQENNK